MYREVFHEGINELEQLKFLGEADQKQLIDYVFRKTHTKDQAKRVFKF
jgi:hypothetical protein